MMAAGPSMQSAEATATGNLHTGVFVTNMTGDGTAATSGESASSDTHTRGDDAKSRGTGWDVSNSPPPAPVENSTA